MEMDYQFLITCLIVTCTLALPAPVSAAGNITVSSSPAGAEIYLNGTTTSLYTPGIIEDVPAGTQNVSLVLTGYEDYSWPSVTVADNATSVLSATLTNLTSRVTFESYPPGAQVYLDNVYIGYSNISGYTVAYGNRTVLMQLAGYEDQTQDVIISNSSETVTATFGSAVENGSISFTSYPSYAAVFLLSNYTGTTPLTVSGLAPGSYPVLLYKSGYSNWTDTVVVTSGTETAEYAPLESLATTAATTVPPVTTATPVPAAAVRAAVATAVVTAKARSVVAVPTPWPTSTTQESPLDPMLATFAAGAGLVALRKR
jgi:hypothetical protein